MKKFHTIFLIVLFLLSVVAVPMVASAQSLVPADCTGSQHAENGVNPCGLDDMVLLFINLYNAGIKYLGAVALVFFVLGGFMLLISGGRSDRVELGKKILTGSVVGIFIVMSSYFIVYTIQRNIFDTKAEFTLGVDTECAGKPEGSACSVDTASGPSQRVYTCIEGICDVGTTQCDYKFKGDVRDSTFIYSNGQQVVASSNKRCWAREFCDGSTIDTNLCPGDENFVCCHLPAIINK